MKSRYTFTAKLVPMEMLGVYRRHAVDPEVEKAFEEALKRGIEEPKEYKFATEKIARSFQGACYNYKKKGFSNIGISLSKTIVFVYKIEPEEMK